MLAAGPRLERGEEEVGQEEEKVKVLRRGTVEWRRGRDVRRRYVSATTLPQLPDGSTPDWSTSQSGPMSCMPLSTRHRERHPSISVAPRDGRHPPRRVDVGGDRSADRLPVGLEEKRGRMPRPSSPNLSSLLTLSFSSQTTKLPRLHDDARLSAPPPCPGLCTRLPTHSTSTIFLSPTPTSQSPASSPTPSSTHTR